MGYEEDLAVGILMNKFCMQMSLMKKSSWISEKDIRCAALTDSINPLHWVIDKAIGV
jgi:hypothetical protein